MFEAGLIHPALLLEFGKGGVELIPFGLPVVHDLFGPAQAFMRPVALGARALQGRLKRA